MPGLKFFNELEISIPSLYFEHGIVFDWRYQPPIEEKIFEKLNQNLPKLAQAWKEKGEPLLTNTIKLLGRPFSRQTLTASLILTPGQNSISKPLMIQALPYLENEAQNSLDIFVCEVYRALLSLYVDENFAVAGDIFSLDVFQGESEEIKKNILLLVIMLSVYQTTFPARNIIKSAIDSIKEPAMQRAWDILETHPDSCYLILERLPVYQIQSIISKQVSNVPTIFFEHAEDLEKGMSPIEMERLNAFIAELKALWQEKGTPLLIETIKFFDKSFHQNELTLSLSIDPKGRPMSHPLLETVRRQLRLPDEPLQRSRNFAVFTIYMLLLFRYSTQNFPTLESDNPFYLKFANEDYEIKNRLFPASIMMHTYKVTGRSNEFDEVVKELNSPVMDRVCKIINEEGGYELFLTEALSYTLAPPTYGL
ncbi:hypothetical protein [Legionella hackeliae]|uniref:Uncharacterized protein n=1 Tax=Legionella hackeliae TaxID=449 RepID=A0A0A8UQE4_LEGHA|nr:hypothetical protein [Legionella hackeliae]KTD13469.1 hypothetical protein Lhac_0853 [Legionella hackeliae]CEK09312.1 protein of unknown function [Legionella hackeliae]STX49217.1 Uncharacterised protein [Legionella hackeliae]